MNELTAFLLSDSSSSSGSWVTMIIYIVIIFAFFYFLFIRPSRKEEKEKNAMLASLEVGDAVLTTAGFYGVVIDITDDTVVVEFGNNRNCRIPMQREAIVRIEKPEDAIESDDKDKKDDAGKDDKSGKKMTFAEKRAAKKAEKEASKDK